MLIRFCAGVGEKNGGLRETSPLVMRPHSHVNAQFLACVLKSDIVIHQLSHLYSGLGRPRVSPKEVLEVKIPIPPDIEVQKRIAHQLNMEEQRALRKRFEAEKLLKQVQAELKSLSTSLIRVLCRREESQA